MPSLAVGRNVRYNSDVMRNARIKHGFIIELIPDPKQGGFTACIPNIPAYGEGETDKEAIADLKEGLLCFIEEYGIEEALTYVSAAPTIRRMPVGLSEFVGMC